MNNSIRPWHRCIHTVHALLHTHWTLCFMGSGIFIFFPRVMAGIIVNVDGRMFFLIFFIKSTVFWWFLLVIFILLESYSSFPLCHTLALPEGSRVRFIQAKHCFIQRLKILASDVPHIFFLFFFICHYCMSQREYKSFSPMSVQRTTHFPSSLLSCFCISHPLTIMLGAYTDVKSNS